jgi:hypothetical protein
MSMDGVFHGGSNDIIGGRVRPKRPEISLSSHGGILVLAKRFTALQKEQTSVITTVYRRCLFPGVVNTGQK